MAFHNNVVPSGASDVIPSDTAYGNYVGLYVGGTGDVVVQNTPGSTIATFKAVPVGTIIPLQVVRVMATGTTATLIVGFTA